MNSRKKNVLIIPPFNPYPLTSGGHQAIFNGIAILNDMANVYVMVDTTESKWKRGEGREIEDVLPFVKVVPFIAPESRHTFRWYWRVLCNKVAALLPRQKIDEQKYEVHQMDIVGVPDMREDKIDFILHCIKKFHIDIVQAEMVENLKIVESLPSSVRKIFVHHELRFVRDELLAKSQCVLSQEQINNLQINKQEEIRLLNLYDDVVTLSPIDTNKLLDSGVKTHITTSFCIVKGGDVVHNPSSIKKILSYVGPEHHYPNYEGVMWFLEKGWNKLLAIDSDYRFHIIGKWSNETAAYLSETYYGVSCLGFVDDLSEAIGGTTMIVPLNIGSGIRMKILEAARIGVPVVSTTVGAEGLPLVDGVHAFITDDMDEFVKDILRLQDEKLRDKFVANTQKTIAEKYSFEALRANRIELYE